ncbi:MAG: inositol monophosphatase family protein [Solirubrobacteraceae bacterium]
MNDVEVAIAVVRDGAAVVRRRFGTALARTDKGGGDFATDADIEAEKAMLETLRRERPGDAVVGEELGPSGTDGRERTWLIDPLCGTLNFAARMRVVAVNAALVSPTGTAVAAVAEPFADRVFWTDGRSAAAREGSEEAPLEPSASSRLVDLNLDPPFPNASWFRAVTLAADDEFTARFRPRVVSSSLALTWVASGQRTAYITDGDVRGSVHFAAGLAICEAAGCRISDLHGERWDSGAGGLIVAADDATHGALVRLVGRL